MWNLILFKFEIKILNKMAALDFDKMLTDTTGYLQPFAISLTKDAEDAKDLLQETVCRALANKDKYHVGTNIKAWLYTIMRNIFINQYRRNARQVTIPDNALHSFLLNQAQAAETHTTEGSLSLKEIKKKVNELPTIFKTPFQLYCDGYKYHEIASMMVEPLGTIKSRIHFARKLLMARLERA